MGTFVVEVTAGAVASRISRSSSSSSASADASAIVATNGALEAAGGSDADAAGALDAEGREGREAVVSFGELPPAAILMTSASVATPTTPAATSGAFDDERGGDCSDGGVASTAFW